MPPIPLDSPDDEPVAEVVAATAPTPAGPRRLDPAVIKVWRLSGLIGTAVFGGGGLLADILAVSQQSWWPLPTGLLGGLWLGFLLSLDLVLPRLRYRHWSYELRPHDLLLRYGVLWRTVRAVPRLRIQHVDVQSGPIDRWFGLANITLYTAGTGDADATIPGLLPDVATALREELLQAHSADG